MDKVGCSGEVAEFIYIGEQCVLRFSCSNTSHDFCYTSNPTVL